MVRSHGVQRREAGERGPEQAGQRIFAGVLMVLNCTIKCSLHKRKIEVFNIFIEKLNVVAIKRPIVFVEILAQGVVWEEG